MAKSLNRERLTLIAGMFGSSHDGERANAAQLFDRMVRESGMTLQQVLSPNSAAWTASDHLRNQDIIHGLQRQLAQAKQEAFGLAQAHTALMQENRHLRDRVLQLEAVQVVKAGLTEVERTRLFDLLVSHTDKLTKTEVKFVEREFFKPAIEKRNLSRLQRLVGQVMTRGK